MNFRHPYAGPLLAVLLAFVLLGGRVASADGPAILPLDEVRAGQTGYGLTVFAGSEVDTFGVKVIGVRHNTSPGASMILVELSGHGLETAAVAQGMSGSPVYVGGKLIGAVAFGWAGALRPIAGVTPAENLLSVAAKATESGRTAAVTDHDIDLTAMIPSGTDPQFAAALLGHSPVVPPPAATVAEAWTAAAWPAPEDLALRLLPRPVLATGADGPRPLPFGIYAVATGAESAGAATASSPRTLKAGSACAVALVTGDAQLGAIGTTSLRQGDRVVMMGHPFMQLGPVDLPLAVADIVTLFPSRQMSFKLGSAGEVIGRVTHDQRAGLAGRLGQTAPTVPVTVEVSLPGRTRSFAYEVALEPQLTPTLVFWCLYNSLLAGGDDRSLQLVTYDLETTWRRADGTELPPVRLSGVTGGPQGVAALNSEWLAPLRILLGTRHAELIPTGVRGTLRAERPVRAAVIQRVHTPALVVPGETFTVTVDLQQWRGRGEHLTLEMTVPAHLKPGSYRLGVASQREFFALDAMRAQALFQDHGLETTLALLNRPRSAATVVAALVDPRPGLVAGGRELPDLPGSVLRLMATGSQEIASPTLAGYVVRVEQETDLLLQGSAVATLDVQAPPSPVTEESRP